MLSLRIAPHPLLHLRAFVCELPRPLGELSSPDWLRAMLAPGAEAPFAPADDAVRGKVRDLLRHGGFKPTGRSKPASEYLLRASGDGSLGSINAAVDACNVVSLHSGLPISAVDADRLLPPLRVEIAPAGASYVFNLSGQEIDLEGLLCLWDAEGPCANAVKDAQRTKTSEATRRTLCLLWGEKSLAQRTDEATDWYRALLERLEARTEEIAVEG
jgi:DNA/RNA-binding domain of Phe-tRNA-synthetase-like protein